MHIAEYGFLQESIAAAMLAAKACPASTSKRTVCRPGLASRFLAYILEFYWDNGKSNGNYYNGDYIGVYYSCVLEQSFLVVRGKQTRKWETTTQGCRVLRG